MLAFVRDKSFWRSWRVLPWTSWRITALLCAVVLVVVACGEKGNDSTAVASEALTASDNCSLSETICIGLVTDGGEIDDRSFNQSAWEGVSLAALELGAKADFIETQDAQDYTSNIAQFADEGYDVIVTVGFAITEATTEAAAKYPNINFIGVDQPQNTAITNLAGLIFPERQAGFLAGALAGLLSESGVVAAVVGTDSAPPVVEFTEGYASGARYINPNIEVIATYHPGGLDEAFSDPEWGASNARQNIAQGADVVFGGGGTTGNGALIETAGFPGVFCIGVDADQWETVPQARPCLVSSAMKLIAAGVRELIENFQGGNFVGEVGLADYHDFWDSISKITKIDAELRRIDAGLRDGSIDPNDY